MDFTFTGVINQLQVIMEWNFGDDNSLSDISHTIYYTPNATYTIPNEEILNPRHTYKVVGYHNVTLTLRDHFFGNILDSSKREIVIIDPEDFPATPAILIVMIAGFFGAIIFISKKVNDSRKRNI